MMISYRIIMNRSWLEGPIPRLCEWAYIVFYEELLVGLCIDSGQPALDPIYVAAEHVQMAFVE